MKSIKPLILQSHDVQGVSLKKLALNELMGIRGAGKGGSCSEICPPYRCIGGLTCPLWRCEGDEIEGWCDYQGGPYECYESSHCS